MIYSYKLWLVQWTGSALKVVDVNANSLRRIVDLGFLSQFRGGEREKEKKKKPIIIIGLCD